MITRLIDRFTTRMHNAHTLGMLSSLYRVLRQKLSAKLDLALPCLFVLIILGCASPHTQLPVTPSYYSSFVKLKLGGRGQVFLSYPLRPKKICGLVTRPKNVELSNDDNGKVIALLPSCSWLKNKYALYTTEVLKKGNYRIRFTDRDFQCHGLVHRDLEEPTVSVKYFDTDFNSGTDQQVDGATELKDSEPLTGAVNYASGDMTDWVRVASPKGSVGLTLVEDNEPDEILASVYRLPKGSSRPIRLGQLQHKVRGVFRSGGDSLYVKIEGTRFEGERKYTLLRRDFTPSQQKSFSVIDCYPIDAKTSMVLLKSMDGMKPQDMVRIIGTKSSGKTVVLGECQIATVQDGQASCRLEKIPPADIVEFKAEGAVEEKS